MSRQHI